MTILANNFRSRRRTQGGGRAGGAYLQVPDDGGVVVDGLAVDGLTHALAVEGELLHGLLLGEVRPLVEHLARRLVLEARHVEEARRRGDVGRHGDAPGHLQQQRRGRLSGGVIRGRSVICSKPMCLQINTQRCGPVQMLNRRTFKEVVSQ